jgi:ribokinase
MSHIDVIGLGALNVDYIYRVDRLLEDGEAFIREAAARPGGSAANTVYGLARLGVSTGFIGVVGDDEDGGLLLQSFKEAGVDTGHVAVKTGQKTGLALCLSDGLGRRSIYVLPGANSHLTSDDIDLEYIHHARILHISSFADESGFRIMLELAVRLGPEIKISFSPGALYAARGLEALKPVLAHTHILFLNHDEISQLTGQDIKTGAEVCLTRGCRVVAVTLGKGNDIGGKPATGYIRTEDREYLVEAAGEEMDAVDTTGAGDAFATGFLYGWLRGRGLDECGRLGDTVARFSIARTGAREGLPTRQELAERYRRLYKQPL